MINKIYYKSNIYSSLFYMHMILQALYISSLSIFHNDSVILIYIIDLLSMFVFISVHDIISYNVVVIIFRIYIHTYVYILHISIHYKYIISV
jgi:hypothetical protein